MTRDLKMVISGFSVLILTPLGMLLGLAMENDLKLGLVGVVLAFCGFLSLTYFEYLKGQSE